MLKKFLLLLVSVTLLCSCGGGGGGGSSDSDSYSGNWAIYAPCVYSYYTDEYGTHNLNCDGAIEWDKIVIYQDGDDITFEKYVENHGEPDVFYGSVNDNGGFTVSSTTSSSNNVCKGYGTYEVTDVKDGAGHILITRDSYCSHTNSHAKYEGTIYRN